MNPSRRRLRDSVRAVKTSARYPDACKRWAPKFEIRTVYSPILTAFPSQSKSLWAGPSSRLPIFPMGPCAFFFDRANPRRLILVKASEYLALLVGFGHVDHFIVKLFSRMLASPLRNVSSAMPRAAHPGFRAFQPTAWVNRDHNLQHRPAIPCFRSARPQKSIHSRARQGL